MNIHSIKDIFPNIRVSRFNLAAWQKPDSDSVYFIGREVAEAAMVGEPDTGILKLFEVAGDGSIAHERLIWAPMYDGINLEDPRALELTNENLIIGLSAVLRDKKGAPIVFPAIIKIDSHNSWKEDLPPFLIINNFGPGKNLTPINGSTYLFRPDAPDYHHKLMVFSLHRQLPEKIGDIEFPTDLPWAQWKIGTTMPPIWITPDEALFLVHGITIKKIDGQDRYIYSIGRAKLTRSGDAFKARVMPEPILTQENFVDEDGLPLVTELHPNIRRVIYSCGGLIKRDHPDTLFLYVNVGDRTTFEVELSLQELKEDLF